MFYYQPAYRDDACQRIHRSRGRNPCDDCDLDDDACREVGCPNVDEEPEPDTDTDEEKEP